MDRKQLFQNNTSHDLNPELSYFLSMRFFLNTNQGAKHLSEKQANTELRSVNSALFEAELTAGLMKY